MSILRLTKLFPNTCLEQIYQAMEIVISSDDVAAIAWNKQEVEVAN